MLFRKSPHEGSSGSPLSASSEETVEECGTPRGDEVEMTPVERGGHGDWTPRTIMKAAGKAAWGFSATPLPPKSPTFAPEKLSSGVEDEAESLSSTVRRLRFGFGLWNGAGPPRFNSANK
jgi:hypothetical protein